MSRIESIRELLQASPDDTFLLYSLAMELMGSGREAEAIEQFRRVLDLDAEYLAAYGQIGQALTSAGDRDGAVQMLTRGIAVADRQGDRHAADRLKLLITAAKGAD